MVNDMIKFIWNSFLLLLVVHVIKFDFNIDNYLFDYLDDVFFIIVNAFINFLEFMKL